MHLIWTLIIGAVIGCIGQLIVGRDMPLGWIGNIIGGLIGAWLGTALLGSWGPSLALSELSSSSSLFPCCWARLGARHRRRQDMKPITKVLFGIVAICGLLQSIGFGLLLWPNREFTRFYVQQAGWLRPVMIGLTGLVILVFVIMLLVAIFRRSTANALILAGDDGDLTLDKSAIENTVAKAIVDRHFAKSVDVDVSIRKKQVARMRIEAFSGNVKELKQEAQRIEETARQKLQACLGVPVKHVRVHLLPATKVKAKTARVI